MSEQPIAGSQLTPEQEAFLLAQQAGQAAAETAAGRTGDAGETQSQIGAAERGPLLPAESEMDALMERMKAQSAEMERQLAALKQQQREALAAAGPPRITHYADSVMELLSRAEAAHGHASKIDPSVRPAVERVCKAAHAAVGGLEHDTEAAVAGLERVIGGLHRKGGTGHHYDWSALLEEAWYIADEAVKIAAAA